MENISAQIRNVVAILGLTLVLGACAPAGTASPNVSADAPSQNPVAGSFQPGSFFKDVSQSSPRERLVAVNFEAIQAFVQNALAHEGQAQTLTLDLLPNESVSLIIDQVESESSDNAVLSGRIDGDPDSAVTLVMNQDSLVGHISRGENNEAIEIKPDGGGVHSIRRVSGSAPSMLEEENDAVHDEDSLGGAEVESMSEMSLTATPVLDVLVAYTPNAKNRNGGTSGIVALIQMGVADANRAYQDSGINLRVRLAGTMEVKQNETNDFYRDLYSLKGAKDGRWDEVHAMRDRLGADQVTLVGAFTGNRSATGIGFTNVRDASAFSVVMASSFRQYTFAHELGHNLGLDHGDGYTSAKGHFRTIIAYGNVKRVRRFSNPSLTYNGFATGDSRHNEAAIINRNAARVSALRLAR